MSLKNQTSTLLLKTPTPVLLSLLALILCIPLIILDAIPQTDVAARYAPMAEAFAAKDWFFAFHPRIPPLLPTTAGLICSAFDVDGFLACKLASALFFALGAIPLFNIFNTVFGKKTAHIGTFLYLFYPHLLRFAHMGFRDTAKGFSFILATYGLLLIFQKQKKSSTPLLQHFNTPRPEGTLPSGYLYCMLGSAGLFLVRGDCSLYAFVFLGAAVLLNLKTGFPKKAILAGLGTLLLISPWLLYQHKTIGYPVPELRHAMFLEKTALSRFYNDDAKIRLPGRERPAPARSLSKKQPSSAQKPTPRTVRTPASSPQIIFPPSRSSYTVSKFTEAILLESVYPLFALFAIPIIILRIRRKEWRPEESFLLGIFFLHGVLQVGQIAIADQKLYVSPRYLVSVSPLVFGWSALGMMHLSEEIKRRRPKQANRLIRLLCICGLIGLYLHASGRIIKSYTSEKKRERRENVLLCSEWINSDCTIPRKRDPNTPRKALEYRTGQRPNILSTERALAYFSSGQAYTPERLKSGLARYCATERIDYIALFNEQTNDFKNLPPPLFSTGDSKYDMVVFRPTKR